MARRSVRDFLVGVWLATVGLWSLPQPAPGVTITGYSSAANDRFASGFPASPVPNTSGNFVGVSYDWSGVGWASGSPTKGFGFITPQHYLVASHYGGAATVTLRGSDGMLRTGTQATVTNTGYGLVFGVPDLSLGQLTVPLPASWQVARSAVLDLNPTSETNGDYTGQPLLVYGRGPSDTASPRVGAATINGWGVSGAVSFVSSSRTGSPSVQLETGDSGSPIFVPWTNPSGTSQLTILGNNAAIDSSDNYYNALANAGALAAINALTTPTGFALWVRGNPSALWTGASGTAISADGNWSGGPRTDQYVLFRSGTVPAGVDVDAATMFRGLSFTADAGATQGFTLSGSSPLTIGRGGLSNYTSLRQTFFAPVVLGDHQYWDVGSGGVTAGAIDTGGKLLEIAGTGTARITGAVSGTGGLAVSGRLLELSGSSSYTGRTWVHAGTLTVDGAITSPVTVDFGGLVGGTGAIVNVVEILAGGTVSPGTAATSGILTVGGLDLAASSTVLMQIGGTAAGMGYDRIVSTGNVDYAGGGLVLQMSGTGYAVDTMFDLFDAATVSGTLGSIGMAGSTDGWQGLSWYQPGQGTDSTLGTFSYGPGVWQSSWTTVGGESRKLIFDQATGLLVVVPEPSTISLATAALVLEGLRRWRRRAPATVSG
jgi:autotransporter-associated beta strand protein